LENIRLGLTIVRESVKRYASRMALS